MQEADAGCGGGRGGRGGGAGGKEGCNVLDKVKRGRAGWGNDNVGAGECVSVKLPPALASLGFVCNQRRWIACPLPSANHHGTARIVREDRVGDNAVCRVLRHPTACDLWTHHLDRNVGHRDHTHHTRPIGYVGKRLKGGRAVQEGGGTGKQQQRTCTSCQASFYGTWSSGMLSFLLFLQTCSKALHSTRHARHVAHKHTHSTRHTAHGTRHNNTHAVQPRRGNERVRRRRR